MRTVRLASLAAACALVSGAAYGDDAARRHVEQAIASYERAMESASRDERVGQFAEAERLFAAGLAAGFANADLETNLGNAALQAERLGQAVLAYRRALLLDPGHARARQNLAHARRLLPDWIPRPPERGLVDTFFFWRDRVSVPRLATTAAGLFLAAAALLALSWVRGWAPARVAAGLGFAAWATLLLSIALDPARESAREGVVIAEEATARAADSINAPLRFGEPLPAGAEVRILEDRAGWLHVELYNGRSAWVTASSVARVGDARAQR